MYEIDSVLDYDPLTSGTNLLVSGPPISGKRRLALSLVAAGAATGDSAILVSTRDSAGKIARAYESVTGDEITGRPIGVVDCVTKRHGTAMDDDGRVKYASSPIDMTGIGISLSEFLEEFHGTRGIERNRVLLHSLSTLLLYSDLQTAFQFLHVFTSRVKDADALGVYVVDSTAHDRQTMNTLKQLFDDMIEVEDPEDGSEDPIVGRATLSE